jgi:anti-sigma B factor antagonist
MSSTEPFQVRINPHGDATLVSAFGELDVATAETFAAAMRDVLEGPGSVVVLDLGAVTFMDSTGLGALLAVTELAGERNSRLTLRRELSPAVERLLELSGLEKTLPFSD